MSSRFADLQRRDAAHHLHPFTDSGELARKGTRIIESAEGCYLTDVEGRKLLDGMSGLWCVNIGYGRKELAAAAQAQFEQLPYYNSFFQCTTPPVIELAAMLAELAPPGLGHTFFSSSGSEANDTVVRLVRHYWATLGQPDKTVIIARHNAYHGSTMAGASLGGMKPMHKQGGLPIPDIVHIDQPYWFGEGRDADPEAFGSDVARQLQQKIDELGPGRVAAFIAEPVQGAGGVIVPPDSYWPEIQRILDANDILFVSDEVICGFGRLGHWFGAQHYGTRPDLMTIAKGLSSGYLPIGGVIVSDAVAEVLKSEAAGEFYHGYTYSGHPVCAAVAIANLKIVREERLVEYVRDDIGPYLQRQWRTLADHELVGEVRGAGMLAALELVKSKDPIVPFDKPAEIGNLGRDLAIEQGLVMRAVSSRLIVAPPLVMTHEQIDELVAKARATLDALAARLS